MTCHNFKFQAFNNELDQVVEHHCQESEGKCVDINECVTGEHTCLESQRCDNTMGSFVCVRQR